MDASLTSSALRDLERAQGAALWSLRTRYGYELIERAHACMQRAKSPVTYLRLALYASAVRKAEVSS